MDTRACVSRKRSRYRVVLPDPCAPQRITASIPASRPGMPKIAFVGAGSTIFTRNLVGDVLTHPELRDDTTFALMDIDAERLRTAEIVTQRLIEAHGAGARIEA